jgi:NUDIX domain.
LIREFKEEIGAQVKVQELKWVGELFFPWGEKPCHQICLFYFIELTDETQIPMEGTWVGTEHIEGRNFDMEFFWMPLLEIKNIEVYPNNASELIAHIHEGVQHFVYREK